MGVDICIDNRFEIIATYKKKLIEGTNIKASPEEMAVIDNILFRFWQMGWLPPIPHGRLIDADALMKQIHETCKRLYGTDDVNAASPTLSAFKLYIGEAPTIIEAEE